jgi:hypothetical protein
MLVQAKVMQTLVKKVSIATQPQLQPLSLPLGQKVRSAAHARRYSHV